MLGKLGRIDGDPVLRETRIWATWEYVSSVGGGFHLLPLFCEDRSWPQVMYNLQVLVRIGFLAFRVGFGLVPHIFCILCPLLIP